MTVFNMPYRLALFSGVSVVIVLMMVWIALVTAPTLARIEAEGVDATARVVELGPIHRSHRSTPGGRSRVVHYVFVTAEGDEITGRREGGRGVWEGLEIGSTFAVRYLPNRPRVHSAAILSGYADYDMIAWLAPLLGITIWLSLKARRACPPGWEGPKLLPILSFR
ncbi:MAG: DUF3592 domain-containing protein [Pseudomonadota bacterium]